MECRISVMRIYLAKHTTTDWNELGKVQGVDSSHLSKKGIEEAGRLKDLINLKDYTFDKIYCSPSARALETLAIPFPDYQNRKVVIDKRLIERDSADLIGLNREDTEKLLGKKIIGRFTYHLYFEGTDKSILTGKFPNNEKLELVSKRVKSLVDEIYKENLNSVLLIGHGVTNQFILEYILNNTIGVECIGDFQEPTELRIFTIDTNTRSATLEKIRF